DRPPVRGEVANLDCLPRRGRVHDVALLQGVVLLQCNAGNRFAGRLVNGHWKRPLHVAGDAQPKPRGKEDAERREAEEDTRVLVGVLEPDPVWPDAGLSAGIDPRVQATLSPRGSVRRAAAYLQFAVRGAHGLLAEPEMSRPDRRGNRQPEH